MSKTTKMDLDRDFNINGRQYTKGKDVEVDSAHVEAIKDMTRDNQAGIDFATTHHGAVPMHNDPQEATAQTPSRPLGGPHLRVDATVKPVVEESNAVRVADPNEGHEAATELAKDAEVVSSDSVQPGVPVEDKKR